MAQLNRAFCIMGEVLNARYTLISIFIVMTPAPRYVVVGKNRNNNLTLTKSGPQHALDNSPIYGDRVL
jgi:hypothetical protein